MCANFGKYLKIAICQGIEPIHQTIYQRIMTDKHRYAPKWCGSQQPQHLICTVIGLVIDSLVSVKSRYGNLSRDTQYLEVEQPPDTDRYDNNVAPKTGLAQDQFAYPEVA